MVILKNKFQVKSVGIPGKGVLCVGPAQRQMWRVGRLYPIWKVTDSDQLL